MSALGIYFGPRLIHIVETKGKRLINNIQISQLAISADELEEKVPQEVRLVALFKDELRKNRIEAKEATIALSGKDLIIRTFDMPLLPAKELSSAINFEVRKYIPFKLEELSSDFQVQFDKLNRSNTVLFIGIKKEILNKYLSLLNQLGFKINSLEYSAFSILRLLRLMGMSDKGIVGVMGVDLKEQGEVNFIVLEKGFPLFSHEINLTSAPQELGSEEKKEPAMPLDRLRTEISVAFEYYNRKFPGKRMEKLCVSTEDYRSELEVFIKDTGLSIQFIDTRDLTRCIGKSFAFSLSFIKGYSCSLSKVIKTPLKINLLSTEILRVKERVEEAGVVSLLRGLKVNPRIWVVALLICVLSFFPGVYRRLPLERQIKSIISMQPKVPGVNPDATYEELIELNNNYQQKLKTLDNTINKQMFLSELLDLIPRLKPEGIWLVDFKFAQKEDRTNLTLTGIAYLEDGNKELEVINTFLTNLKGATYFNNFVQVNIVSVEHSQLKNTTVTNFTISCQDYHEKKRN